MEGDRWCVLVMLWVWAWATEAIIAATDRDGGAISECAAQTYGHRHAHPTALYCPPIGARLSLHPLYSPAPCCRGTLATVSKACGTGSTRADGTRRTYARNFTSLSSRIATSWSNSASPRVEPRASASMWKSCACAKLLTTPWLYHLYSTTFAPIGPTARTEPHR